MSFDLVLIRRFEAVYRLRSFSLAAKELGMTHSAMTKSIRSLEDGWNVRLFDRTTRSVTPTDAGRRLAATASDLLAFSESTKANVQSVGSQLRIICGPAVIDSFIHGALLLFIDRHPDIKVHIETLPPEAAAEQLMQRRAQLLLFHARTLEGLSGRRHLTIRKLVSEPYLAVYRAGHPVEATDLSLEAMLQFDWAVAGFDAAYQAGLQPGRMEQLQRQGFPRYRVLNQSACIEIAARSDVMTVLPATAARPFLASGALRAVPFPGGARFSIGAATLASAGQQPAVAAFVGALQQSWEGLQL